MIEETNNFVPVINNRGKVNRRPVVCQATGEENLSDTSNEFDSSPDSAARRSPKMERCQSLYKSAMRQIAKQNARTKYFKDQECTF